MSDALLLAHNLNLSSNYKSVINGVLKIQKFKFNFIQINKVLMINNYYHVKSKKYWSK